uniref:Uncharacterized protein n=1 Tax=Leersia perrieri TaxID=77586 RepID=A0A0D9W4P8_9ORYZ
MRWSMQWAIGFLCEKNEARARYSEVRGVFFMDVLLTYSYLLTITSIATLTGLILKFQQSYVLLCAHTVRYIFLTLGRVCS